MSEEEAIKILENLRFEKISFSLTEDGIKEAKAIEIILNKLKEVLDD